MVTIERPMDVVESLRARVLLPEPPPNRVQSVAVRELRGWLRSVVARDRHGYALLTADGRTCVLVYADGIARSAVLTRGGAGVRDGQALGAVMHDEDADCLVVTHRLSGDVAIACSGLLRPAVSVTSLGRPAVDLKALVAWLLAQRESAAVVVASADEPEAWGVLLAHAGQLLGSFGSDNRAPGPTISGISAVLPFGALKAAVHPAWRDEELMIHHARAGTEGRLQPGDDLVLDIEAALIELCSRIEAGLTRAAAAGDAGVLHVAAALTAAYRDAGVVPRSPVADREAARAIHPLMRRWWDDERGEVDVTGLLDEARAGRSPGGWPDVINALSQAVMDRVAPGLDLLAHTDPVSALTLRETLTSVLGQASEPM